MVNSVLFCPLCVLLLKLGAWRKVPMCGPFPIPRPVEAPPPPPPPPPRPATFLVVHFSPGLNPLLFSPPPNATLLFPQKSNLGFCPGGEGDSTFLFLVSIPPFFFLWEREEKLFSLDYYEHPGWKFSALPPTEKKSFPHI